MAHSSNEYQRKYLAEYRRRQAERKEQRDAYIRNVDPVLREDVVRDMMSSGYSREQSEDFVNTYTMPSELWEDNDEPEPLEAEEESRPCGVASDSIPDVKKDCWATEKSIKCQGSCNPECYHAYFEESHKPQAQKDAERTAKTIAYLAESKAQQKKDELQDLVEIGAAIQRGRDERQEKIDVLTKKYVDQGVDQVTAEKDAEWDLKQIENAERVRNREIKMIWDSLPEYAQFDYKLKLLRDGRKLLEGTAKVFERKADYQPKTYGPEKMTRGDEYGKPILLNSHTVPDSFGKTPWQLQEEEKKGMLVSENQLEEERRLLKEKLLRDSEKLRGEK